MPSPDPIRPPTRIAIFLLTGIFAAVIVGCLHDGGEPRLYDVSGRVRSVDGEAAADAMVYLARQYEFFPASAPVVVDSTRADRFGIYRFDGLDDGEHRVYAGVWDPTGPGFALVSAFSPVFEPAEGNSARRDLQLAARAGAGALDGAVRQFVFDAPEEPAADAEATLLRFEGSELVTVDATTTDALGRYAWTDVATGNYVVSATKLVGPDAPFPQYLMGESQAVFCDGLSAVTAPDILLTDVAVEKPALYVYPQQEGDFAVDLRLGDHVRLTASEPEYGDGWRVRIAPSGRIDGRWDYLFYELALGGWPRIPCGWCVDGDDLRDGLGRIVAALGLNEAETADFLDYWLARLPRRPWYEVRPLVDAELDGLTALEMAPAPDAVRRFWLFFAGRQAPVTLPAPSVAPFERRGCVAVEWGGAVRP